MTKSVKRHMFDIAVFLLLQTAFAIVLIFAGRNRGIKPEVITALLIGLCIVTIRVIMYLISVPIFNQLIVLQRERLRKILDKKKEDV